MRISCIFIVFLSLSLSLSTAAKEPDRPTHKFDRDWLKAKAKSQAQLEFVEEVIPEDNPLSQLSYDDYKKIQFERGATIWSKEDRQFRLSPMHPGFLFKTPVRLNLVVNGVSRRILYTTDIFDYDDQLVEVKNTEATGYSGFRITNPINRSDKWDEFLVFQGATYFRGLGEGNWYGLSSRGLAVNTARPSGEEFPMFTDFWIERPNADETSITIHALMESRSITGAFTFTATPGKNTVITVESTLYPRTEVKFFGIGPLTSMFLYNSMNRTRFDDFRPAVHDSEGLFMISQNGEHIWRPLSNPKKLQISVFKNGQPKGFGLLQRRREFHQFEDAEAHYQDRPSAWVEPLSDWGPGHVELIEIPTSTEIHDNIVAFWQPKETMQANKAYDFNYKIHFGADLPMQKQMGVVVSSASGLDLGNKNIREFVIDYDASQIPDNLTIVTSASTGKIVGTVQQRLQTGQLRVIVKFEPAQGDMSELRVALNHEDKQWGETWLYRWTR